jgi:hypothetical protein
MGSKKLIFRTVEMISDMRWQLQRVGMRVPKLAVGRLAVTL